MKKPRKILTGKAFADILLEWNREKNDREMPWKGEKDPYKIWLSEIILQQTRVEQGLAYYQRFIGHFPTISRLAAARDQQVLKLWEGLGYYTRCRNLLATAGYIAREKKGEFPDNYKDISQLKGVGAYTAAAISSFAFNLPYAVVDGNVSRVLSRVFGIHEPAGTAAGRKKFMALAHELLDKRQPGLYNQAIMDFGAVVCKPAAPLCTTCPFREDCIARREDLVSKLPVKRKKPGIKKRWFYYLLLDYKGTLAVRQRNGKDIWQGLFEFPLVETKAETKPALILQQARKNKWLPVTGAALPDVSALYKQQLSHQLITGRFIRIRLKKKPDFINDWQWMDMKKIKKLPFPQYVNQYLRNLPGNAETFKTS